MVPPGDEHDCAWQSYAKSLSTELESTREELITLKAQLEALNRKVFGKSSEKMPPMDREVRRGQTATSEQRNAKRKENADRRARAVEDENVSVPVPDDQRCCPKCDGTDFITVGEKPSVLYDWVAGYFRRRVFQREVLACTCRQHVVTAAVPDKVFDRTQYGPSFIAHLIVTKCCDAIPIHRLEKQYARLGIPMARSTMTALFNRAGELLMPIADEILRQVSASELVLADETPWRLQRGKRGYVWTFNAGQNVAYCFSASRSGETPERVLGGTQGTLLVDMYTGYNLVTGTGKRERAGCLSHVRRKFFEASGDDPDADVALEIIRSIYVIEHDVKAAALAGTEEHARLRRERTLPILDKFYVWLAERQHHHLPRSEMGKAIRYAMKNWQALTRFICDVGVPPDNNRSENALRIVALLRKNSLFAFDERSATKLAALLTIVATCIEHRVEPTAYLTHVLTRLDSTTDVATLLPQNWAPAP